ncbi:MAG: hypothetical protein KJP21_05730 [Bacteroidia bacterium]|nr:hypothetical protein [Bacteroidia bacterium]
MIKLTELLAEQTGGSADDFANDIKKLMLKYFPTSYCYAGYSDNISESIWIKFAIGKKSDWYNGIIQNAPVEYSAIIFGIKDGKTNDKMSLESSVGARVTIKPPENSYLAYGRVRVPTRKTRGGEERILKAIEKVISTLKKETKQNLSNMTDDHQWVKKYI